jgi:tryptophan synthase alpha chain
MSRYQSMFNQLSLRNEGALVPFFVLGFPDRERCLQTIDAAIAAGADALELGIPFSDPVADGPVIVEAGNIARANGTEPPQALDLVAEIRRRHPDIPIGLLLYANLLIGPGMTTFLQRCKASGVDSILVADIPLREAEDLRAQCSALALEVVFILAPNASAEAAKSIAKASQAYVYLLSRAGVTGADQGAGMPLSHLLDVLQTEHSAPAILGFGISRPAHVRDALRSGARGVIVGSALVATIANAGELAVQATSTLIKQLKLATKS